MQDITLNELPQKYKTLLNSISNSVIEKLYSQFSFKYYMFSWQTNDEDKQNNGKNNDDIIFYLSNYLKNFKFIVFYFPNILINENSDHDNKIDCILSFEGRCLIIEQIDHNLIETLIQNLQKQEQVLINVNNNQDISIQYSEEVKNEIQGFCDHFRNEIDENEFIKYTINSIVGYLIRKYFYPSNYFDNNSFFNFKSLSGNKSYYEFKEDNFIILRTIYQKSGFANYYLVMHTDTFYIFLMKKFDNTITTEMKNEIDFCESHSH